MKGANLGESKSPGAKSARLIAITGLGHVGRNMVETLGKHFDIVSFDPKFHSSYPSDEIKKCAIDFICVGTPANPDGSCDISNVVSAVKRSTAERIVVKSTVPPGTTDSLSKMTGKRITFSPEYFGEGPHSSDFWKVQGDVGFTIFGGGYDECNTLSEILAPSIPNHHRTYICSAIDAEFIKYMENSFLATKVAFVNEFYDLVQEFGGSWTSVREGWLLDPRIGRSHTTVLPEDRGFGGRCLPKDLLAILVAASGAGVEMRLLEGVLASNKKLRGGKP